MLLSFFLGLLFFCFVLLYLKWMQVANYWNERKVPNLPPHLLYGNLNFLSKKNIAFFMREIYTKFESPYVGIWWFWRPALVINSPEIARNILVKDSDVFRDRLVSSGPSDPIGHLNLFTVNDPIWSNVRRRLTSVFTTAKLKSLQSLIIQKSKELCQRIQNELDKNKQQKINLKYLLADVTTDIIGTAAFGVVGNATLTGDGPVRRITRDFQTYNKLRGYALACVFFLPELVDWLRMSFFPKSATDVFRNIFHTVVKQRGGLNSPSQNRDLLDALIKMKQDADKEKAEMSIDLMIAQATVFLQGGFETTAVAMAFSLCELAAYPEIQEKLYQEIIGIKQKLGDAEFDIDTLTHANYLNAVIKETLRKYPPMGWLDRISNKEYQVDENLTIPARTPVYVNAVAMQVDPKYYPEPMKFKPERFMPENEMNIENFTYLPFGDGPRMCIGSRFAQLTMRFILAHLITNFEFKPWTDSPEPNDIKFSKHALFLVPGEIISVQFIPRHSSYVKFQSEYNTT